MALLSFKLLVSLPEAMAEPEAHRKPNVMASFNRLSSVLRRRLLDAAEEGNIRDALKRRESPTKLYAAYLQEWMSRDALTHLLGDFLLDSHMTSRGMFLQLARAKDAEGTFVYYLPHTVTSATAPCDSKHQSRVHAWWASQKEVLICADSYNPQRVFDQVGYCAGSQEPGFPFPSPPRPGCGCGPLLLACVPPKDEMDWYKRTTDQSSDEIVQTALDTVVHERPFTEVFTTSRTWQSGVVRFLYLRRELIGLLAHSPFSPSLDRELQARVGAVNLDAPGEFVDRQEVYRHSGVLTTTPGAWMALGTYRGMVLTLFDRYLCTEFHSIHVDSQALLATVGEQHAHLRSLDTVSDSPMRHQLGCSNCHAPMDFTAELLEPIRTPLFGSMLTDRSGRGRMLLRGPQDERGEGVGYAGFSSLLIQQPEFKRCLVRRTFELAMGYEPQNRDNKTIDGWAEEFEHSGWNWRKLLQSILRNQAFAGQLGSGQ